MQQIAESPGPAGGQVAGSASGRDPSTFAGDGGQYLTFLLSGEEYALDILKVQEIKGLPKITPVPNAPPHVLGVMNLRGAVVPVADLRARFGLSVSEDGKSAVVIVANVGARTVGLVVDAVSDVLSFAKSDVEPTPDLGAGVDTSFLTGLAKSGDRLVLLLDAARLVGDGLDAAA
jgi:purine-binding chemotaxis protein CheW